MHTEKLLMVQSVCCAVLLAVSLLMIVVLRIMSRRYNLLPWARIAWRAVIVSVLAYCAVALVQWRLDPDDRWVFANWIRTLVVGFIGGIVFILIISRGGRGAQGPNKSLEPNHGQP